MILKTKSENETGDGLMSFFKKKKQILKDDVNLKCCHDENGHDNTLELIPHFKMVSPAKYVYICRECGEIFEIIKK